MDHIELGYQIWRNFLNRSITKMCTECTVIFKHNGYETIQL